MKAKDLTVVMFVLVFFSVACPTKATAESGCMIAPNTSTRCMHPIFETGKFNIYLVTIGYEYEFLVHDGLIPPTWPYPIGPIGLKLPIKYPKPWPPIGPTETLIVIENDDGKESWSWGLDSSQETCRTSGSITTTTMVYKGTNTELGEAAHLTVTVVDVFNAHTRKGFRRYRAIAGETIYSASNLWEYFRNTEVVDLSGFETYTK
jgi:hypothetical protein